MKNRMITAIMIFCVFLCTGCGARKAALLEKNLAEMKETLEAQITETGGMIQKLTEEKDSLQNELEAKNSEISRLNEQAALLTDEKSSLETKLQENTEKLEQQTVEYESKLDQSAASINELSKENETLKTQAKDNRLKLSELSNARKMLLTQISEIESENKELGESLRTVTEERDDLVLKSSDNEKKITNLQKSSRSLLDEKNALQAQMNKAQESIDALTEENTALGSQLSEAQENISTLTEEKTGLEFRLTEAQESISALADENDAMQAQLSSNASLFDQLQNSSTETDQLLAEAIAKNESLAEKIDALQQSADTKTALLDEAEATIEALRSEIDSLQASLTGSSEKAENEETETIIENTPPEAEPAVIEAVTEKTEERSEQTAAIVPENPDAEMTTAEERTAVMRDNFTEPLSGIEMLYVPAGAFLLGSKDGEKNETPQTELYLDGYWIGKTEVTNEQYRKCVEADICDETNLMVISDPEQDGYPVTYVSYSEAQRFCSWIGGKVPTEFQWEKAARGTDGRTYPWGEVEPSESNSFANIPGEFSTLQPAGLYPDGASPYGALDMGGNAWEWTSSWFVSDIYAQIAENGTIPEISDAGFGRVIRGGSSGPTEIGNFTNLLRSAYRGHSASNNYYIGFRCIIPDTAE